MPDIILSSGENFDASTGKARKSKLNESKKILMLVLFSISFIGLGYFMIDSNPFANLKTEKPIAAASLTQDQKIAITQANNIGDQILSECTTVLSSSSADCNIFVKQLADNCNTELKNYFKYCSDARLQSYLTSMGGYEALANNNLLSDAL